MDMEVIRNPSTAVSSPPVVAGGDETKTLKTSSFKGLVKSDSMRKTMERVHSYIEEVARVTKFNPQDDWLPITESRNGNAFYSAFHTLSSGIGFQALLLPLAFVALGWSWGIICLSLIFVWQLYTIWLLVELHESQPGTGTRFSRYLRLSIAAFGVKRGKLLTIFPIMYLSGGSCVTLIMIGGGTLKIFFQIVLRDTDTNTSPLTTVEWYLLFVCFATLLAQLPNLNSIAGVSLVGAIAAVLYCTLIWVLSIVEGRSAGVSYDLPVAKSEFARVCSIFDALGIIAFAFRGHNLILEIQGTMPSSETHPSKVPMWRGVEFAYLIIGICYFPLAIASYWAYGNSIPTNGGMLRALEKYHGLKASETILGITCLLVVINSLSSFQIYAMPVFDNLEFRYVSSRNKPCPTWLRCCIRVFFGGLTFFISVALPFLPSLAGLIGGVALPLTLAYPCFMWIVLKKPGKYSSTWCLNWVLGVLGVSLSLLVIGGAIYSIITKGIEANFFKPK